MYLGGMGEFKIVAADYRVANHHKEIYKLKRIFKRLGTLAKNAPGPRYSCHLLLIL